MRSTGRRLLFAAWLTLTGCQMLSKPDAPPVPDESEAIYNYANTHIDTPDVDTITANEPTAPPLTLDPNKPPEYWDVSLQEVIQTALTNSKAMRDMGGGVLRSPASTRTVVDPAIIETDPRFGVAAALSAFDATFSSHYYAERNDRAINNVFFGGGTRLFHQDATVVESQITKMSAQGTQMTVRNHMDYDGNNSPGNQFYHAYNFNMETEFRQPFLQGAGTEFNRITGPNGLPGFPTGVMIARVNTDISLAEFEIGVRNLVNDVENAYWDLYFAYRDLDAKITARDAALETWRRINALYLAGRRGGEAEKEAQAREQYYRFEEEVQNAMTGRLLEGTRTNNGSSGGTFRSSGGVHVAERRLRLLTGLPISDGRLMRPVDEPKMVDVTFDWDLVLHEALERRAELRRQKWHVKRREMELVSSRNFLLPRLDAIGRYRWRGFGNNFMSFSQNQGEFDNAVNNLMGGNFQEWQLGAEFSMLIGNRRGHSAVRNAELQLARERILLREQEREVTLDLSNSVAEMRRAFKVMETTYNRRIAARQQLAAVQAAYDAENAPLEFVLEAQRRLADADSHYYRSLVEYGLSVKNVHFEKGSLLDYNNIYLAESMWPSKAYNDAKERESLRTRPLKLADYLVIPGPAVDRGEYPQNILPEPATEKVSELDPLEAADGAEPVSRGN